MTVGLEQPDLVVVLVGVGRLGLIDVPDEQAPGRQLGVEAGLLPVLDEEVLLARSAVLPESMHLPGRLDVGDADRPVDRDVVDRRPALIDLAPGGRVSGGVATAVPGAAAHEAPVAHALGRAVGVVEVGEPKEQVPELMRGDAELGVLGDRQIRVDLGGVGRHRRGQHPLVRPDVARVTGLLPAAAGVNDDVGVDEPIAIVVVGPEVHMRVRQGQRIGGQVSGSRGPRGLADPEVTIGVPRHRLR